MDFIELKTGAGEHLTSDTGFEDSVVGEGCVGPADEAVVAVPCGLAVAEEA